MEAVQAAVERACEDFKVIVARRRYALWGKDRPPLTPPSMLQNPATHQAAEQVLLQFRRSQHPLPGCQHILAHSHSTEARFHAACTLREACLRDWASMAATDRAGVRSYMLQYILAIAADAGQSIVRVALVGALAVVLKRGWLEMGDDERQGFFQELERRAAEAAAGAHGEAGAAAPRRVVLEVLDAVVSEFSLSSSSALGMAWDFHERCRAHLEVRGTGGFVGGNPSLL